MLSLLNTLNRIKFESNQLKYLLKNINLIEKEFENKKDKKVINFEEKIEIKNLSFSYLEKNEEH